MKTYSAKSEEVKRAWWVIDAAGQPGARKRFQFSKR